MKEWIHTHSTDLLAYGGLVFCLALFSILSPIIRDVNILDPTGLAFKSILRDGVILCILSCGAVFVYSLNAMDISVGAQMSLYCVLLVHIYNITGSTPSSVLQGFILIFVIAMVCGIINSVIGSVLKIIPIITSLFLMFTIYGINALLFHTWNPDSEAMAFNIGTASSTDFSVFREPRTQVLILIAFLLLFAYLFNYTKIGKYTKAIGANPTCASQAGINLTRYKMIAYLVFGVSIVVASVVFVANAGTTTSFSGVGYEMKVMVCLIIGGMRLSGGMRSKISSAVVGGFTFALISRGFVFLGIPDKFTMLFVAIIFIILILVTCRSNTKTLPR